MLSRGTCTDRNWGTSCPQKCTGGMRLPSSPPLPVSFNSGDYSIELSSSLLTYFTRCIENNDWDRGSVIIFLEDNDDSPTYCCDGLEWNSDNNSMGCVTGSEPFQLDAGKAMIGVAALKGLALSDSEDHDAGVINIRQMSNSTAKPEGNGTSSTGSNPTATACFNATTLPGTSNNSGGNSGKEAAIGAGVGVPLGLIAVASLAWAIWLQRQNRNLRKAQTQTQTQGGGQGQFLGQMGYGAQSGMMPSGGYMNHGPVTYGHHGHHHGRFVELGEMDGDPKELSGMSSKQSV